MCREVPDQAGMGASLDAAAAPCRTSCFYEIHGRRPLPVSGRQESGLGHNLRWGAPGGVATDPATLLGEEGAPTRDLYHA